MGLDFGRPVFQAGRHRPYESFLIIPNALTHSQCERVIQLGCKLEVEQGEVQSDLGGHGPDPTIRSSVVSWISPGNEANWLFRKMQRVALQANRSYGFDLWGFGEDLQFTRYDRTGAFYTWHQDGLDGELGIRKLSIVVQLSEPEDYEGSELQFFDIVEHDDPQVLMEFSAASKIRGTAIVFPSFEYHRVLPLRSGQRYSLVSWVSGPPFR